MVASKEGNPWGREVGVADTLKLYIVHTSTIQGIDKPEERIERKQLSAWGPVMLRAVGPLHCPGHHWRIMCPLWVYRESFYLGGTDFMKAFSSAQTSSSQLLNLKAGFFLHLI